MPTSRTDIRRGEIYWLDWNPARGSEQAGRQPALIVGSDAMNQNSHYPLTIIAAISSAQRNIRTHVVLEPSVENGLRTASSVKCEQILTVSKDRLQGRIGRIGADELMSVADALNLALSLGQ